MLALCILKPLLHFYSIRLVDSIFTLNTFPCCHFLRGRSFFKLLPGCLSNPPHSLPIAPSIVVLYDGHCWPIRIDQQRRIPRTHLCAADVLSRQAAVGREGGSSEVRGGSGRGVCKKKRKQSAILLKNMHPEECVWGPSSPVLDKSRCGQVPLSLHIQNKSRFCLCGWKTRDFWLTFLP